MRSGPICVHGRTFEIDAVGIGGDGDPFDAIDSLMDWLEAYTASQVAVLHIVLAATQDDQARPHRLELDEIAAAQAAALRFARRGLMGPHAHSRVTLRAR